MMRNNATRCELKKVFETESYTQQEALEKLKEKYQIKKLVRVKKKYKRYDDIYQKKEFIYTFIFIIEKPLAICNICEKGIYEILAYFRGNKVCQDCYRKLNKGIITVE